MSTRRVRGIALALAGVFASAGVLLFCTSPRDGARRAEHAPALSHNGASPPEAVVPVVVFTAESREAPRTVEVTGLVEPVRSVVVAAEVEGRVVSVPVEEHSRVEEGQALVRLDPVLLKASADRARAVLGRARAAHRLAQLELERQRGLARENVASAAELDRAESEAKSREATLLEARAALEDATARLERAVVRAPFAGVVHRLDLEPGAYLVPGADVAELVDLSEVEVGIELTDRQLVVTRIGTQVTVEVGVYEGELFPGEIAALGRATRGDSRKYPVTVRLPNPDERLLPGMVATVRMSLAASGPTLQIPRAAIRREFEVDYVFVLDGSGKDGERARRRRVVTRPVPFEPERIEVVRGLQDGERIAVSRVRELRDGTAVRVAGNGT